MAASRGACCSGLISGSEAERVALANAPFAVSELLGDPAAAAQAVSMMLAASTVAATAPVHVSFMGPDISVVCRDHTAVLV